MAGPWEKYKAAPAAPAAGPWAKYAPQAAAQVPDVGNPAVGDPVVDEQMPDQVGMWDRFKVKNFSNDPTAAANYLADKYPDLEVKAHGGQFLMRPKGSKEAYKTLDPQTGFHPIDHPLEALSDVGDSAYDIGSGALSGLAATAGGVAGGIAGAPTIVGAPIGAAAGAAGAGAATSASLEALRQKLGSWLGIKQDLNGKDIAIQGAIGAAAPLLMGTGGTAASVAKASAGEGAAGLAAKLMGRTGLSEAEQAAITAAQRGLVSRAGSALKGSAETAATRALGLYQKEAAKLYGKGEIQPMGRALLDEPGLFNGIPKSYDTLAQKLGQSVESKGQDLGQIISELDGQFHPTVARDQVGNATMDLLKLDPGLPGNIAKNADSAAFANEFTKLGGEAPAGNLMSLGEAEGLKRAAGSQVNWQRPFGADIPEAEKPFRALYKALAKGSEDAAETAAGQAGGAAKSKFTEAKRIYGLLANADLIANKRAGKEVANRLVSPSDYITAAAGLIKGGPAGLGLGVANKFVRTYGNQLAAPALDTTGNMLLRAGKIPPGMSISAWNLLTNRNGDSQ